jgi:hypothetical protein
MKYSALLACLLLSGGTSARDEWTEVDIHNDNIGNLKMSVPGSWRGSLSTDDLSGTSVFEVLSKKEKFQLRIEFSYIGQEDRGDSLSLDEYIERRLDNYMDYQMAEFSDNSVEGAYTNIAFGPDHHGVYARLTIRDKGRNAYQFVTHGARIIGDAIVVFTLYSSDSDRSVLDPVVDVVAGVASDSEIASFVGSYTCRSEHRVGFDGRNIVWTPDIADVVDQQFVVRTSSPGDQFADKTSWVFVEAGRTRAGSWCDDAQIGSGRFVCHGANDEEFRMDTSSMRFLYVRMQGYYDQAEGTVPDEDRPAPFMDIGRCEQTRL